MNLRRSSLILAIFLVLGSNAATLADSKPLASDRLKQMIQFYSGTKSLSYTVTAAQVVRHDHSSENHSATYDIKLSKPSSLAVDVNRGKSQNPLLGRLNDKEFGIFLPEKGFIRQSATSVPEPIRLTSDLAFLTSKDAVLFGLMGTVTSRNPIEIFTFCKPFKMEKVRLVGNEEIDGVTAEHINLVTDTKVGMTWDIWVQQGNKPWIRRAETRLRGRKAGEELLISTNFSKWQENPSFDAKTFAFVPPVGSKPMVLPKGGEGHSPADKLKGKEAQNFSLHTVDGGTFNLAASKGKEIVVLDFWATWCGPCRQALPILIDVTSKMAGKGVKFVAVDFKENAQTVKAFLKTENLSIKNVVIDSDGRVCQSFAVQGIPQSVIIGKDGKIKAVHVGFGPNYREKLTGELNDLLAGKEI